MKPQVKRRTPPSCPLEVSRFEDAVKSTGNEGKLLVKDIIELVVESMGTEASSSDS